MYLEIYKEEIRAFCQKNKVKNLHVFGSVLRDRFTDKSDIDMVVDIDLAKLYEVETRALKQ